MSERTWSPEERDALELACAVMLGHIRRLPADHRADAERCYTALRGLWVDAVAPRVEKAWYTVTISVNGEVIEMDLTAEQMHREFPSIDLASLRRVS